MECASSRTKSISIFLFIALLGHILVEKLSYVSKKQDIRFCFRILCPLFSGHTIVSCGHTIVFHLKVAWMTSSFCSDDQNNQLKTQILIALIHSFILSHRVFIPFHCRQCFARTFSLMNYMGFDCEYPCVHMEKWHNNFVSERRL